jgi:multicomponent K+:H+ antiporter subunit D
VVLVVGFFTIVGLARAGVVVFWHVQPDDAGRAVRVSSGQAMLAPVWAFMALTVAMAVLASPVKRYTDAAAASWPYPAAYVRAVLGCRRETPDHHPALRRPARPEPTRGETMTMAPG